MSGLRAFVVDNSHLNAGLAERLDVVAANKSPLEVELRVNQALLRLFGVRFAGNPLVPFFSASWNGSKRGGYTMGEVGETLSAAGLDILPEQFVDRELSYRVEKGLDFTYRFDRRLEQDGVERYVLVRDALIWE